MWLQPIALSENLTMLNDVTSRLSWLGFRAIAPPPALQPYVQCYWSIRADLPPDQYREELQHPSGGSGMTFNLGETLYPNKIPFPNQCFYDGTPVTSQLGLQGKIEALGVRFHPAGAYLFLQQPLHHLVGSRISGDDLDAQTIPELYARIYDAPTLPEKFRLLENWLLNKLRQSSGLAPVVPHSLELIRHTRGQLSIQSLADSLYLSQRQLERLYKEQVGISPKLYARLMRIEHAREALRHADPGSLTEIGYATGFYDQSHFIKEFTAITGITPHHYWQRVQDRSVREPSAGQN